MSNWIISIQPLCIPHTLLPSYTTLLLLPISEHMTDRITSPPRQIFPLPSLFYPSIEPEGLLSFYFHGDEPLGTSIDHPEYSNFRQGFENNSRDIEDRPRCIGSRDGRKNHPTRAQEQSRLHHLGLLPRLEYQESCLTTLA